MDKTANISKMSLDKDYDDPYNEKVAKRLGKIHRKILPPPAHEKSLYKSLTKSTLSLLDGKKRPTAPSSQDRHYVPKIE